MAAELPALTPEQMAQVEEKLVTSGLAKLNTGVTPSKLEMEAIERAGLRGRQEDEPPMQVAITELGLEVAVSDSLEKRGIHDASRLLERKPEVFRIIAGLLARAVPIRDICDLCRVSASTVQSVADHPEAKLSAVTQKEQFIAKLRLAASLGLEALIERFKTGEVTAIEFGIVVDKLALAEGGVTARTEIIHTHEEEDDWTRMCREARRAQATGMVIEAEEVSPRGAALSLAAPQITPEQAARDIQSPEMESQCAHNQ